VVLKNTIYVTHHEKKAYTPTGSHVRFPEVNQTIYLAQSSL